MIKHFICDVDGCLTDGSFLYTPNGKLAKRFGPHDSDGLKLLKSTGIEIRFISADKRGYGISYCRITRHMGYPFQIVSEEDRYDFVKQFGFEQTAFMGDGYHDAPVLRDCALGFAPLNARPEAKAAADYITDHAGGDGAVMDACLYLREFYDRF